MTVVAEYLLTGAENLFAIYETALITAHFPRALWEWHYQDSPSHSDFAV